MGYYKDELNKIKIGIRGYYGPSSKYSNEMCLLCGTEFTYDEFQDDTPGFKEHTRTLIKECKCGKCNNWKFTYR